MFRIVNILSIIFGLFCSEAKTQNHYIGLCGGINIAKTNLEQNSAGIKPVVFPAWDGGILSEFNLNKFSIRTGIYSGTFRIGVKRNLSCDTSGNKLLSTSLTSIPTIYIPILLSKKLSNNEKKYLSIFGGIVLNRNMVWKEGKAPSFDTSGINLDGKNLEAQYNFSLMLSLPYSIITEGNRKLEISLNYKQGLFINERYMAAYCDNNIKKSTIFFTRGTLISIDVNLFLIKIKKKTALP